MKIFQCDNCAHPLFFENTCCENCGRTVAFDDENVAMKSFDFKEVGGSDVLEDSGYRFCKNNEYGVCNWLVEKDSSHGFCAACALNRTIPDLSIKSNHEKWDKLEIAKHRLVFQLQRFGLDFPSKFQNEEEGLCFDFLAKTDDPNVGTGHVNGIITILLSEADSVLREQQRKEMSEPYRTLIGHFRHEVGHYYWDRLVATDEKALSGFREIFGDERIDYSKALNDYYITGGNQHWTEEYISKYATSHPWEDWAESWAHYMHIMDITETAHYFGLGVAPTNGFSGMTCQINFDPYREANFDNIIEVCIPLIFASNAINRSMGIPDVYPFIITESVIRKMKFIHTLINQKVKQKMV